MHCVILLKLNSSLLNLSPVIPFASRYQYQQTLPCLLIHGLCAVYPQTKWVVISGEL